MKQNISLLMVYLGILSGLNAQQLPLLLQHKNYSSFINPGAIKSEYFLFDQDQAFVLSGSYRYQWMHYQGPKNIYAAFDYLNLNNEKASLFLGGSILLYDISPIRQTGAYLRAGARLNVWKNWMLSLGFNLGGNQYKVHGGALEPLHIRDPSLPTNIVTQLKPDLGFGIFIHNKKIKIGHRKDNIFYAGASVPQLLKNTFEFGGDQNKFQIQQQLHWFGFAGFVLQSGGIKWESSMWGKYVQHTPFSMTFRTRFYFSNKARDDFWLGAGLSSSEIFQAGTLHTELGLILKNKTKNNDRRDLFYSVGSGFDFYIDSFSARPGPSMDLNFSIGF